MRRIYLNKNL